MAAPSKHRKTSVLSDLLARSGQKNLRETAGSGRLRALAPAFLMCGTLFQKSECMSSGLGLRRGVGFSRSDSVGVVTGIRARRKGDAKTPASLSIKRGLPYPIAATLVTRRHGIRVALTPPGLLLKF